jgi:hypothetical protein
MKTRWDSSTRGLGRSSVELCRRAGCPRRAAKGDEAIAEADTLLLTVPNQLGVAYSAHAIEAILTHVAPALGWRERNGGPASPPIGAWIERCIHQGRQCRNCVGDTSTRPPGFAPSEPCHGSGIEGPKFQLRQAQRRTRRRRRSKT